MSMTILPGAHDGSGGAPPRAANRLIHERSPYLLQHAHNPVDWLPWGSEALEQARREEKPIFLSIGYSTCHWCHVMERESFENEQTARFLNEHFVSIKVDREERPDLDHLYMSAVQAMAGQGGWPLNVFLTPDREPFFGGTYFPPEDRWGRPGFRTVLEDVAALWKQRCGRVTESAGQVTTFLHTQIEAAPRGAPWPDDPRPLLTRGAEELKGVYDARYGGFGHAPKFPTPHHVRFLLRHAQTTGDTEALAMAVRTLDAMAAGGIHDHLGGGFHRYATDSVWLVPHFEKMLYDQAGLAQAYTDAWQVTQDPRHAAVVRGILDYVLRDLTHPEGGFYSAEDADSEGEEGTFYVWRHGEIIALLGPAAGEDFCQAFGVAPGGNWEGRSILHRLRLDGTAPADAEPLTPALEQSRKRLLEARNQRPRPHRDEKIIAAWNGHMIAALAQAGRALAESRYVEAAARAMRFAEQNLWLGGRLTRHWRDGQSTARGYLDDYAFMGLAYIALHEALHEAGHKAIPEAPPSNGYLAQAVEIGRTIGRLFGQPSGALAYTGRDAEALIAPIFDIRDGALPSSLSAAVMLLLQAGHLAQEPELIAAANAAVRANGEHILPSPTAHSALLAALTAAPRPPTPAGAASRRARPRSRSALPGSPRPGDMG